jgi:hypothetical protein
MNTIDKTQAQLNTHEEVCAFRYESICARMKRMKALASLLAAPSLCLLIGILLSVLEKGAV